AYRDLDHYFGFKVDFVYTGSEEAIENYRELMSEPEAEGVPGSISVRGGENVYRLSLDAASYSMEDENRLEQSLFEELEDN
ncbi:MAG: hypothetical protein ABEJ72_09765, partial [Candidatus Aenigmatarchaeota archaeon]